MIELEVIGGCRADGPCEQGSMSGKGFKIAKQVDLKDESIYDDSSFSPQLVDTETGLPFMESIMQRFPRMEFVCAFCQAPIRVGNISSMEGVAVEVNTETNEVEGGEAERAPSRDDSIDDLFVDDEPFEGEPFEEESFGEEPFGEEAANKESEEVDSFFEEEEEDPGLLGPDDESLLDSDIDPDEPIDL